MFNSFLQGVYPVGVTDLRPYFTHIIGHNSVYVHRIPTKVGTTIRSSVPNFSPIRVRIRVLCKYFNNDNSGEFGAAWSWHKIHLNCHY